MRRYDQRIKQARRQPRVLQMYCVHGDSVGPRPAAQRQCIAGHTPTAGDQNIRVPAGMGPACQPAVLAGSIKRGFRQQCPQPRHGPDPLVRGDDKLFAGPVRPGLLQRFHHGYRLQPHACRTVADNPDMAAPIIRTGWHSGGWRVCHAAGAPALVYSIRKKNPLIAQ